MMRYNIRYSISRIIMYDVPIKLYSIMIYGVYFYRKKQV